MTHASSESFGEVCFLPAFIAVELLLKKLCSTICLYWSFYETFDVPFFSDQVEIGPQKCVKFGISFAVQFSKSFLCSLCTVPCTEFTQEAIIHGMKDKLRRSDTFFDS